MDRVTTNADDIAGRVLDLLRGAYLTGAEAQRIRCAVGIAECRLGEQRRKEFQGAMERYRQKLAEFEARAGAGAVPPRPWTEADEDEAVLQGQDGPDPEYVVAPRFGGVETRALTAEEVADLHAKAADGFPGITRSLTADRPEGMPDALAPLYAVQGEQAAMSEQYRCPLTGDAPDDDDDGGDDPDSTPVVPFDGDAQEGE